MVYVLALFVSLCSFFASFYPNLFLSFHSHSVVSVIKSECIVNEQKIIMCTVVVYYYLFLYNQHHLSHLTEKKSTFAGTPKQEKKEIDKKKKEKEGGKENRGKFALLLLVYYARRINNEHRIQKNKQNTFYKNVPCSTKSLTIHKCISFFSSILSYSSYKNIYINIILFFCILLLSQINIHYSFPRSFGVCYILFSKHLDLNE